MLLETLVKAKLDTRMSDTSFDPYPRFIVRFVCIYLLCALKSMEAGGQILDTAPPQSKRCAAQIWPISQVKVGMVHFAQELGLHFLHLDKLDWLGSHAGAE